jgi:hypothetical protein
MSLERLTLPEVAVPCPTCSRSICRCDEPPEWISSATPWCEALAANA